MAKKPNVHILTKEEWNIIKEYYNEVNSAWETCSNIKNIPNAEVIKLNSINTIYKAQIILLSEDKNFDESFILKKFRKEFVLSLELIVKILDRIIKLSIEDKSINVAKEKIILRKAIKMMNKKINKRRL